MITEICIWFSSVPGGFAATGLDWWAFVRCRVGNIGWVGWAGGSAGGVCVCVCARARI